MIARCDKSLKILIKFECTFLILSSDNKGNRNISGSLKSYNLISMSKFLTECFLENAN